MIFCSVFYDPAVLGTGRDVGVSYAYSSSSCHQILTFPPGQWLVAYYPIQPQSGQRPLAKLLSSNLIHIFCHASLLEWRLLVLAYLRQYS
jgi:hypothetical protein